jgi:RNA polymerase sigma factor (sigma-70 family)
MTENHEHVSAPIDWATVTGDRYAKACRVIKRSMPRSLQATYDPEDFVGDAIVELMAKPDRFVGKGWVPLVLVARRRMIDAVRSPRSRLTRLETDIADRQPPAALEQEAAELRERMLGRVDDPSEQNMIKLRCSGHTLSEIAELTGVGLRTIQRFWKAFKDANEPY